MPTEGGLRPAALEAKHCYVFVVVVVVFPAAGGV